MSSAIGTKEQQGFFSASRIKLCSIVGFIKTWGEQTRFYFWRYSVVVCRRLSHFNSQSQPLGFTWNRCRLQEAKKFSRNPGQCKCVTRETRYHVSITELLKGNLYSQVAELIPRLRTMLKILYISGAHQFFQISPGIKPLYDRGKKLFYVLVGGGTGHNLGPGRQFQPIYWPGKPPGRISPGHLDRVSFLYS